MPQNTSSQDKQSISQVEYQNLVRRVAEKVWELWREELRRDRERRSGVS